MEGTWGHLHSSLPPARGSPKLGTLCGSQGLGHSKFNKMSVTSSDLDHLCLSFVLPVPLQASVDLGTWRGGVARTSPSLALYGSRPCMAFSLTQSENCRVQGLGYPWQLCPLTLGSRYLSRKWLRRVARSAFLWANCASRSIL